MALCNSISSLGVKQFFKTQTSLFGYLFIWLKLSQKVDQLGLELQVQTHINEPPCSFSVIILKLNYCFSSIIEKA